MELGLYACTQSKNPVMNDMMGFFENIEREEFGISSQILILCFRW